VERGPLEHFDRAKIPEAERHPWQPKELVAVIGEHHDKPGPYSPVCVAFSPNGKYYAASFPGMSSVRLWDTGTGREVTELKSPDPINLSFAPNSQTMAITRRQGVTLWDLDDPPARVISELPLPPELNGAGAAVFSPDSKALLVAHYRVAGLWDLTGRPTIKARFPDLNGALAWSHDGKIAVVVFQDKMNKTLVYQASAPTDKPLELPNRHANPRALAFAPVGTVLASGGDRIVDVFDLAGLKRTEPTMTLEAGTDPVYVQTISFSPDGKLLAAAAVAEGPYKLATTNQNGTRVCVWDLRDGKRRFICEFPFSVRCVAFAADGRHLATANTDGTIYMLRLKLAAE
jgi:WD40 repeat protein